MKYCITFPMCFCDFINVLAFQSGILKHTFCALLLDTFEGSTCLSSQNIQESLFLCAPLKPLPSKESVLDDKYCFDFKQLIRSAYRLVEAPFISLAGRLNCTGCLWGADPKSTLEFNNIVLSVRN